VVEPLRIAVTLGIGDVHWAIQKMRGLKEHHGGRPLEVHINKSPGHATVNFLRLVPLIDQAVEGEKGIYGIRGLEPTHRHPRWSSLKGSACWKGLDYAFFANGHLERGERIETWMPELETDYTYPLAFPPSAVERAEAMVPDERPAVIYMSGNNANAGFHNDTWKPDDWWHVIRGLNEAGVRPCLVGADTKDDRQYRVRLWDEMGRRGQLDVVDLIGQTSHAEVFHIIQRASFWVGLNCGLGIVAAMLGTPTVMLWSDDRYLIPGQGRTVLHHAMQTSWLSEEQLATYRTLSFGSPGLTPEAVLAAIMEVRR